MTTNNTIIVQIGNTDDKLLQVQWSAFVGEVRAVVDEYTRQVHFCGTSAGDALWQNACFVGELFDGERGEADAAGLIMELRRLKDRYSQESIAVTFGNTQFV